MTPEPEAHPAVLVADAAVQVPGVADLHGGPFGTVATYTPGRRVTGVQFGPHGCEVHVSVDYDTDLRAVGDAVRSHLDPLVDGPVHVVVEDVRTPHRQSPPPRTEQEQMAP